MELEKSAENSVKSLSWPDGVVVLVYLVSVLTVGIWVSRKYFLKIFICNKIKIKKKFLLRNINTLIFLGHIGPMKN